MIDKAPNNKNPSAHADLSACCGAAEPENATFSSEPCRWGPVFGSDSENSLFEAKLKFCIFTPKKYFAHSGISSTRNSQNSIGHI